MDIQISKTKKIIIWLLASLLLLLYLGSAGAKLFQPEQMNQMQLANWRVIIAISEIIITFIFLFPKTNKIGTLLLSSYMGGAIVTHMIWSIPILMPVIVLILVWLVFYLRNPQFFKF
ncbi:DoxX family protein [Tenacibaculum sp. Bg11-29]|uniref:DoxX family protein n=1 Tax=Tenacibaculum sp. Bg11-29 TaxID=2058306 RepID=UPI000C33E82B|nr:DoxX family protein [Tenacibaculum sp. Bg11-29]PKH52074.1 DoxX family protein [Tenacibaculum sp. Bg11-29]